MLVDQDMNQRQEMEQGTVKEDKTNQVTTAKLVKCTTASPSAPTELPLVKYICVQVLLHLSFTQVDHPEEGASTPGSVMQKGIFFFLLLFIGALMPHEVCV